MARTRSSQIRHPFLWTGFLYFGCEPNRDLVMTGPGSSAFDVKTSGNTGDWSIWASWRHKWELWDGRFTPCGYRGSSQSVVIPKGSKVLDRMHFANCRELELIIIESESRFVVFVPGHWSRSASSDCSNSSSTLFWLLQTWINYIWERIPTDANREILFSWVFIYIDVRSS
jgi:hypothetical protein